MPPYDQLTLTLTVIHAVGERTPGITNHISPVIGVNSKDAASYPIIPVAAVVAGVQTTMSRAGTIIHGDFVLDSAGDERSRCCS